MSGEILLTTAREEKVILGKIGAKFDSSQKKRLLYAYRLQHIIANKLLFSNYWQYPSALIAITERLGLADDETCKFYISKLK